MFKLLRWAFLLVVFTTVIGFVFCSGYLLALATTTTSSLQRPCPSYQCLADGLPALARWQQFSLPFGWLISSVEMTSRTYAFLFALPSRILVREVGLLHSGSRLMASAQSK